MIPSPQPGRTVPGRPARYSRSLPRADWPAL